MARVRDHWREYLIEAGCLALFMVSAAGFATLLYHPRSPLAAWHTLPMVRRIPMGLAMGLSAIGLIYSPWGRRSGAHMNPAITLTFLRLGKIERVDAAAYVAAQFAGGLVGIAVATMLFAGLPADPSVNFVLTRPGPAGASAAIAGEVAISFGMMWMVLTVSNHERLAHFTGLCAGALVALYIVFEEPLSGMSMNPARSFGPAVLARMPGSLWIYFVAPPVGMLAAAEAFIRLRGGSRVRCAKLHHPLHVPCIFRCGHAAPAEAA